MIRTLDIGGDKPIPYLPLPPEDNPALGLRGVRTSLWRPDLLARAVARDRCAVQPPGSAHPVADDHRRSTRSARCARCSTKCAQLAGAPPTTARRHDRNSCRGLLAAELAREVDFLSIGTNDLTQYTLAMDRGHAELATRIDGLHPAVLRLIARRVQAQRMHRCPVAVCGGLASDPAAVPVLLGLGVQRVVGGAAADPAAQEPDPRR